MTVKDSKRRVGTCPETTENASHGWERRESSRVFGSAPRNRAGFTLVEMLTVIVIIGILAGLVVGATIAARLAARRAVVVSEMKQLEMALQTYKSEVGELPPDFAFCDEVSTRGDAARTRVLRHLRKAYPRMKIANFAAFEAACGLTAGPGTGQLNPSTALTFWLGGMVINGIPSGFHEDPANPFKGGKPRKKPYFEFRANQLSGLQYMQPKIQPMSPYVYFRAIKTSTGGYEYGAANGGAFEPFSYAVAPGNLCVPYLENAYDGGGTFVPLPTDPVAHTRIWRAPETYQLLAAGVDGLYSSNLIGSGEDYFRYSIAGRHFTDADFDNLASFAEGELEDEMQ